MYLWSISFGAIGQQTPTSKADYHQKKAEHFSQLDSSRLAIIHYQKAYQLVSRIDNNRAADLCVDICSEYYKIGDFKSAISICQKGLYHLRFLSTLSALQKHVGFPRFRSILPRYSICLSEVEA